MVETTFLNRFFDLLSEKDLFGLVWYTKKPLSEELFSGQASTSGEKDILGSRLLHMAIPRIPTVAKKRAPKIWKRILRPIIKWTKKILQEHSEIRGAAIRGPCPKNSDHLRSKRRWSTSPLSRRRRRPATKQVWDLIHESQK